MKEEIEEILTIIAEKAQLAEGIEGVRSTLLTMYRFPSLKNKKVSQKTGIAIPALAAVRGELVKAGLIERKNFLGENGRAWIRENLNLKFEYDPLPYNFDFSLSEIPKEFPSFSKIEKILENRPEPDFALDQSHAISSTVVNRALYLLKKGDIEGRKIVFLGDDDATSLAVGLLNLAEEITVIDIDPNVIKFLSESANNLTLKNYNVVSHDLRESSPISVLNKYDIVVMDPPYTNEGLRLFLKRAKQLLKTKLNIENKEHKVIGKRCLLCFGNKPPKEMQQIQLSILDHGFIIKEMIPYFNLYKGASILGQFSHLYYLELAEIQNVEDKLSLNALPIYTADQKARKAIPYRPIGYHFVGEMRFSDQNLLLENDKIQKIFLDALNHADLITYDIFHHNYQPYGYSAVAILKTSHATIHTWPEHGYISVDIFICDEFSKGLAVVRFLINKFKPETFEFLYMERGKDSAIKYEPLDLENKEKT
ncbi:MAG: adenosylmethionine decarboxylase [Candidatus Lokiarchaeota archaeon]|nr:adenosylmethionine decarboxylase [Candidatus Lokiarchaeota archaeon]